MEKKIRAYKGRLKMLNCASDFFPGQLLWILHQSTGGEFFIKKNNNAFHN